MKVLQINAVYGYGSTGLIVKDIGDALTSAGHEAYFAYQSSAYDVECGFTVGNKFDHKTHALLCRLFGKQGYYSHGATKRLIRHIKKIKPDVVHLHNLHSNFVHLNKLLEYLGENDIATVITMHDCWYFTGKCFHYVDAGCDRFTSGCGNCPKRKAPPSSLVFDCSAKVLSDRDKLLHAIPRLKIVGCSNWICREAKRGIMKDLDVTTIRNGVDIVVFKPRDKSEEKKVLGLDGRFVIMGMANKWFLPSNVEFFKKIKSSLSENDRILLVGCTESQMRELEGEDRILAVGFIRDRETLAKLYCAADVFVNVTHADTLPTVNMESICCGTPVITYDSCGSPELVLENCGYVVSEGDINAIIDKIRKSKINTFTNIAESGYLNFDKNKCYLNYIALYNDILNAEEKC